MRWGKLLPPFEANPNENPTGTQQIKDHNHPFPIGVCRYQQINSPTAVRHQGHQPCARDLSSLQCRIKYSMYLWANQLIVTYNDHSCEDHEVAWSIKLRFSKEGAGREAGQKNEHCLPVAFYHQLSGNSV